MKKVIIVALTMIALAGSVFAYQNMKNAGCCCGTECTCTNCTCTEGNCTCDASSCEASCCQEQEACCSK